MLSRILGVSFVLILFLPILEGKYDLFPVVQLAGAEKRVTKPAFTSESWFDGSYQKRLNEYREKRLGLRSYFVKTFNQIHYTLFYQVTGASGGKTDIVIGKDGWLYEKGYINKLNAPSRDDGYCISVRARQLQALQRFFISKGIPFVFVLAPSKPEIYPEQLPKNVSLRPLPSGKVTDYSCLTQELDSLDVDYVDCTRLFLKEKKESGYDLFSPGGVHWNKYGAALAWQNVSAIARAQQDISLPPFRISGVERKPSEPVEADLAFLLNIWYSTIIKRPTDYPIFNIATTGQKKPSILLVGDSFLFTIADILIRAEQSLDVDAWYYFNTEYHYTVQDGRLMELPLATSSRIDRREIDWQKVLSDKDLVVLVQTKKSLPDVGFGFLRAATTAFHLSPTVAQRK